MATGRGIRGSRYRPSRKRPANTTLHALVAAAVAAGLLAVLGAHAVLDRIDCTDHPVVVDVATSADIQPVVHRMAELFNGQHNAVDGHCVQVDVSTAAAATVAAEFAAGGPTSHEHAIDAWVPDSGLWLNVARATAAGARLVPAAGASLAMTPLLIAMPGQAAKLIPGRPSTAGHGTTVSWSTIFPQADGGPPTSLGLHVQFPDAAASGAGLAALVELRRVVGFGVNARAAMARFILNAQVIPAPGNVPQSLDGLAHPVGGQSAGVPLAVTTEQAVVKFDQANPQTPLTVRYPAKGTPSLTYPYVVTTATTATRDAAQLFGRTLLSHFETQYAQFEGFRSTSGTVARWPSGYGLAEGTPLLSPAAGSMQAAAALRAWHALALGDRILSLMDISSTMAVRPVPGGPELEQLLGKAAAAGLARLPDSVEMGLWAFASNLQGSLSYKPLVAIGPIPSPVGLITRRQEIQEFATKATAAPTGAALYGSVVAAYKYMTSTYQPQHINDVLLLTGGVENASDEPLQRAIGELQALYNPHKPVEIIVIEIGGIPGSNLSALQQIAAATNGKVFVVTSPSQMPALFFHVVGRRVCSPKCA